METLHIRKVAWTSNLLLILTILPTLILAQPNQNNVEIKALALIHATVIDATGAKPEPDMTVVIKAGHIAALGITGKVRVPRGATIIDARGKFLIPGLWDMHVHTSYKSFLTLFIANGITGVRDMGGSPREFELLKEWRGEISKGTLIGPRIVAAGTHVDGPSPLGRPNSLNVATASEGREAVDTLKQRGADFIKVYSMLPREAYFAIGSEAKKQGLPFAGHVPASVSATEASDAGQKSMEHLFGVLTACSSDETELRNKGMTTVSRLGFSGFVQAEIGAELSALKTIDDKKSATLFRRFVQNRTWQVPTLAAWHALEAEDEAQFRTDRRLKFIPRERRETWKVQRSKLLESLGAEFLASRKNLSEHQLKLVDQMQRAGVGLMTGTDTAAPYLYPGFSAHEELVLLVQAGLTPMQALQAATRNPAEFLGLLDSLGTVERGKIADLVLLEANPLENIRNTQRIAAVVVAGKLLTKEMLQRMLADVVSTANN